MFADDTNFFYSDNNIKIVNQELKRIQNLV